MEESRWDKKRIIIGIFSLALLIAGGILIKTYVLTDTVKKVSVKSNVIESFVKGAKTDSPSQEDKKDSSSDSSKSYKIPSVSAEVMQEQLQQKLDSIKKQVNSLNVVDVATSSSQFKKAVSDLQSLQALPQEEAKKACLQICNSL